MFLGNTGHWLISITPGHQSVGTKALLGRMQGSAAGTEEQRETDSMLPVFLATVRTKTPRTKVKNTTASISTPDMGKGL